MSSRESRLVLVKGATQGDFLESLDGTRLRVCSGYCRASRRACRERPTLGTIAANVVSDDEKACAGLGQGCSCRNPFPKCNHEGTATFSFKQIGSKILKVCEARGTNADELLQGEWTWKAALTVIKGDSDEKPPWLQLRRTLFAVEEKMPVLEYLTIARAVRAHQIDWLPTESAVPGCLPRVRAFLLGQVARPSRFISLSAAQHWPRAASSRIVPGLLETDAQLAWYSGASEPVATVARLMGDSELETEVWKKVSSLNPSQLKSFMQKIVRWGDAVRIVAVDEKEVGDLALRAAFLALFFGPGMFVPDIRDHSTGQRLALQRMVVTLFEDGIHTDDVADLTYWGALAATQQKNETPVPLRVVQEALAALVRARHSRTVLSWRQQKAEALGERPAKRMKKTTSVTADIFFGDLLNIFEAIGAMEGDKQMIGAVKREQFVTQQGHAPPLRLTLEQSLWVHLDQHAEPLMPHVVPGFDWFLTTGFNPRSCRPGVTLDWQRLKHMEEAQKRALQHSQKQAPERCAPTAAEVVAVPFRCDATALIAYAAGQVPLTVSGKHYLAVFCPSDLNVVVLMRKPKKRETADIHYIEPHSHEYEEVVDALRQKSIPLGDPLSAGYKLMWWEATGVWQTNRELPTELRLPSHAAEETGSGWSLATAPTGDGCREGWEAQLHRRFLALLPADRTEVVRMLSEITPAKEVKMVPLTRSAQPVGTRYEVYTFVGTVAHQCPGALETTSAGTWLIKNSALFAHVRHLICEWYAGASAPQGSWRMAHKVEPHEEQRACLDRVMKRKERRNFFMAKTGAGKTLVAAFVAAAAVNDGQVDHVIVFMDTEAGLNSVATELRRCVDCSCVWLDPRKGGSRQLLVEDAETGLERWEEEAASRGSTPRPLAHHINLLRYDHFAQYEDLRNAVIAVASTSLAAYDEVDRCYGETLRTRQCIPLAFIFKHLIMLTATPLRKHGEGLAPRLAIASLFAPFPLQENNLLVFFCGHVKTFEHPVPYPELHLPPVLVDVPPRLAIASQTPSFDDLAQQAFNAALPQLLATGLALHRRTETPCIIAVQTLAQVKQVVQAADGNAQEAPKDARVPTAPLVVLAANAARGRNFGRHCGAMVHMPLKQGVPARRQLHGRLHRGPLRELCYQMVIPRGTVLECLSRIYLHDDAAALNLELFVRQALALERARSEEPAAKRVKV